MPNIVRPVVSFRTSDFYCRLNIAAEFQVTFPSLYESIVNGAAISTRGLQWLAQKRLLALQKSPPHTSALGWLIITAERGQADKTATAELLGNSDHPLGKLGEIAEALLEPLADDALIAKVEDEL